MDLNKAIRDLYEELEKLNEVIASLEEFQRTGTLPLRRAAAVNPWTMMSARSFPSG